MFKFLRKKLKKFENQLEAEIETELKKEEKQVHKQTMEKSEPIETPRKQETHQRLEKIEKKETRLKERKKKKEKFDEQIEKTIETELKHTLKTRKIIGEMVQRDKKATLSINEEKLDELLWDLEVDLLESDVAYQVIESIKKDIKNEMRYVTLKKSEFKDAVEKILKKAISNVLKFDGFNFDEFIEKTRKPIVIMFVGVNGSGKTLSIAKMAYYLKKKGKSCVMAAGDTFRAGAIEQLGILADDLGVKLIKHKTGADPAAVAYDAIEHAKSKHKDVVLLDTAGRIQTDYNLMDEMAKIKRVAKPDLIVFVGDALAGNDAVEQAKRFNETVGIDGVILTKVDADAKGGSALSVAYTIGKPLLFIGVGQKYDDQIPFDPEWMLKNIFQK